jgi:hypothetical protein
MAAGNEGEDEYVRYAPEVVDFIAKQLFICIREIIAADTTRPANPVQKHRMNGT